MPGRTDVGKWFLIVKISSHLTYLRTGNQLNTQWSPHMTHYMTIKNKRSLHESWKNHQDISLSEKGKSKQNKKTHGTCGRKVTHYIKHDFKNSETSLYYPSPGMRQSAHSCAWHFYIIWSLRAFIYFTMSRNNFIIRTTKIIILFLFKVFPASHVQVVRTSSLDKNFPQLTLCKKRSLSRATAAI